jgi:hypothetical protein
LQSWCWEFINFEKTFIWTDISNIQNWLKYITMTSLPNFQLHIIQFSNNLWIAVQVRQYFSFFL